MTVNFCIPSKGGRKYPYFSLGSLSQYLCTRLMLEFAATDAPVTSTMYAGTSFVAEAFVKEPSVSLVMALSVIEYSL